MAGSARNARTAIFGLVITMVGAPFIAEPLAAPLGLAGRLVGAILAGYLLWIATRGYRVRTGRLARRLADRHLPGHRCGRRRLREPRARGPGRWTGHRCGGRVRAGGPGRPAGRHRARHPSSRAGAVPAPDRRAAHPDEPRRDARTSSSSSLTAGLVAALGGAVAVLAYRGTHRRGAPASR